MNTNAKWIKAVDGISELCPEFRRSYKAKKTIASAEACVTALGMYNLYINGKKVGYYLFAPGYTSYAARVQLQRYDITEYLKEENEIAILTAKGWCYSAIGTPPRPRKDTSEISVLASFKITYTDGEVEYVCTDESWDVWSSRLLFSEHYDGEIIDPTAKTEKLGAAILSPENKPSVVEQVGEYVREKERVLPSKLIITPKGERVIDFG